MPIETMLFHPRPNLTLMLPTTAISKNIGGLVRGYDLKSMSLAELWKLHEEVTIEFAQKLELELEQRLRQQETDNVSDPYRSRRPCGPRRFDA
jgi:hypothetical protein